MTNTASPVLKAINPPLRGGTWFTAVAVGVGGVVSVGDGVAVSVNGMGAFVGGMSVSVGNTVNMGGSTVGDGGTKVAEGTTVLAGPQALARMTSAIRMSVLPKNLSRRRIARYRLCTIVCSFFVFTVPSTQ
jgi:UDP-3-O-[3-hydroxymyristoyl] glucosamine N-acyltransferase